VEPIVAWSAERDDILAGLAPEGRVVGVVEVEDQIGTEAPEAGLVGSEELAAFGEPPLGEDVRGVPGRSFHARSALSQFAEGIGVSDCTV